MVTAVHASDELGTRALELASTISELPGAAVRETKRKILLERDQLWGALFEEEERAFREALLGS